MTLKVGDKAPGFTLPDSKLKLKSLSDFAGEKVVLAFFPGAFTGVCTKEMCTFRDSMANLKKLNAKVVGVSVDTPFSLAEFDKKNNLNFDLLSDSTRAVSKSYGGIHEDFVGVKGLTASKRSIFVLDKEGKIRYEWVSEDPGKEPDYKKIQEELSLIK
ncbi:MAG: peroxiredoxin [Thermoplasmatales archaeon B_DKE]|nr:MAG: peroxiredoxin [Thermoplasmatales archaeon B_DKE]QRF76406.1 putative peroxiredoxin [Thermoplasmatales archaeon]